MKTIYLLGVLATIMLVGCSSAKTTESSSASKDTSAAESNLTDETSIVGTDANTTFTVGFDQDFPPMGFVGDDGEFTGFDLELAAEVAKRLGKEIKYQPIAWDAKDMELTSVYEK